MATEERSKKLTNIKSLKAFIDSLPDEMPVRTCWGDRAVASIWIRDKGERGWPAKFLSLGEGHEI